jgi:S1-C subfamily serine protease
MNLQPSIQFCRRVFATALAALTIVCCADVIDAQEAATKKQSSRYPTVVLEREASFSLPNTSALPAAKLPSPVVPAPFLPKEIYQRTSQPILDATDLIAEGFDTSVVEVHQKDQRIALATVVSTRGHVLTKHSLVRDVPQNLIRFRLKDKVWSGTLVGFDETDDIALYALHSGAERPWKVLRSVNFTTPGRLKNGKIVIGIGTESQSLGIGMTTAPPSEKAIEKDCETCIDMGMTLSPMMKLTRVYPRTVGERLGLLVGDRLLTINRKQVSSRAQFDRIEKEIQAGDLISITFERNGQAFEVADKVPDLTKISKRDRWGGGPFSKRRSGFDDVLVHDSVIDPLDCGGPLVNLEGQFCGINIARSMRVASLAIPAESVLKFLQRYLDSSDLAIER